MKHYPPRPPRPTTPEGLPTPRRRIPAFHPVPIGKRRDGWTAGRQAAFIGMLFETRSVVAAARAVGMGRESAYRLRKRPGAAGFAAAWDAALGLSRATVALDGAKSTGLPAYYRARVPLLQVLIQAGRFAGVAEKPDDTAVMQHLAQLYRACAARDREAWFR